MSGNPLVRMSNQIADYFKVYPEDQAAAGVHEHIVAYWTPKMRHDLKGIVDTHPESLHPLVIAAVNKPVSAQNPAEKSAAGPVEAGEIGASDAG